MRVKVVTKHSVISHYC